MPFDASPRIAADGQALWTVGALTAAVKETLETAFSTVRVEGEVSNCRPSSAGHLYFTLKDATAVISAALFRGRASRNPVRPENGMKVIVTGRIDVYPPRGSYQIIVDLVEPAGRGALLEALERRKAALAAEGLFDAERKRPLPPYPRRVAVVTSPTGAAIRDILRVLSRRSAAPRITVLPTAVQGAGAGEKIARQITIAGAYRLGDAVIVARGGGSLEDLLPFSDDVVVRAVAASPLPVVAGIGHESDVSLAGLAADVRAATPSAAAELVSDRSEDLLLRVRGFLREGNRWLLGRIDNARRTVGRYTPADWLRLATHRVEEGWREIDHRAEGLVGAATDRLAESRRRYEVARRGLEDGSPRAIMERGYARVSKGTESILSARDLEAGENVTIRWTRSRADATITEVGDGEL